MKKIIQSIFLSFLVILLSTGQIFAATAPNYWKKISNAILPINDTWTLGSELNPVSEGHFDSLFVNGLNVEDGLGGGGVSGNLVIDGDGKFNAIPAPLSAPTTSLISPPEAGNVDNGDHKYIVTYVTEIGETAGSSASTIVSVSDKTVNGKVVLTIPVSPDDAVKARNIYRQFNGTGNYKFLASVANNTATTYTDNIANSSLGDSLRDIDTTGSLKVSGKVAIGNLSQISKDRNFDFSNEITDFFTDTQQYNQYSYLNLIPSANLGTGAESFVASENIMEIDSSNTHDINYANFSNGEFLFSNNGSGDLSNIISLWGGSTHAGSGDVTFELVGGYFTSFNSGSGSIPGTCEKCGNFAIAGGTGNFGSGTIARDYVFYAESPYNTGGGTISKHWGLYMEDQEVGTESWAIQTHGGKVDFGSPTGKDPRFTLSDDDVSNPWSGLGLAATTIFNVAPTSSTLGGTSITTTTDGDAIPLNFTILQGINNPSFSTPYLAFNFAKNNGSGSVASVGQNEMMFNFINNGTSGFMCRGSRLCGFSNEYPNARVDISSNGTDSSTQSFQVTSSNNGNSLFRIRNDAHVTVGATSEGQNGYLNVNGANSAGGSASSIETNATLGIMNGSDNYTGLKIGITNANHTGSGNTIYGINIPAITFDADATATAITIGDGGWTYGLQLPNNVGVRFGTSGEMYTDGSDIYISDNTFVSGSLNINNGTSITKHLSEVLNNVTSASISGTSCGDYASVTVTGAAVGDSVYAVPDADSSANGIEENDLSWSAYVSATNTITIRACNPTALSIDAGDDQEWRVDVWQH